MNLKIVILINLTFQTLATLQILEGNSIFAITAMLISLAFLGNLLKRHLDFNQVLFFALINFMALVIVTKVISLDLVFKSIYLLEFLIALNISVYFSLFKILKKNFYFYLELIIKLSNLIYLLFLTGTLLSDFDNYFYPNYYNIDNKLIIIAILTLAFQPINYANIIFKISTFRLNNHDVKSEINMLK